MTLIKILFLDTLYIYWFCFCTDNLCDTELKHRLCHRVHDNYIYFSSNRRKTCHKIEIGIISVTVKVTSFLN